MSTLMARALRRLGLLSMLALGVACSSAGAVEPEPDDEPGDEDTSINDERLVTRWVLPASVAKAGAEQSVEYDNPPSWNKGKNCTGTFTAGAKQLGYHIKTNFSKVTSVGGYSCRQNTANKAQTSVHGTGRAIDIMIKPVSGKANSAAGDKIANWLVTHAEEIGVQYVIWNRTSWNGSTGKSKNYTGPNPHIDHIHAEVNERGGARLTPWFGNGAEGTLPPDDTTPEPTEPSEDPDTTPSEGPDTTPDPDATPGVDPGTPGSEPTPADPCGGVDEVGTCTGTTLRYCSQGNLFTIACNEKGMACGYNAEQGYQDCVPTPAPSDDPAPSSGGCGSVTVAGQCQGDVLSYCNEGGQISTVNCAAEGLWCDYNPSSQYYDCL